MEHEDDGAAAPLLERRCQLTPGYTTLSQRWGTLRLLEDRLVFDGEGRRTSFSAPVSDLHSPRNFVGRGITVYQGDRRLKFDFSYQDPFEVVAAQMRVDNPTLFLAGRDTDRRLEAGAQRAARLWTAALAERVAAEPPDGVRVKKTYGPEERTRWLALVLAAVALGVAVGMGLFIFVMVRFVPA